MNFLEAIEQMKQGKTSKTELADAYTKGFILGMNTFYEMISLYTSSSWFGRVNEKNINRCYNEIIDEFENNLKEHGYILAMKDANERLKKLEEK